MEFIKSKVMSIDSGDLFLSIDEGDWLSLKKTVEYSRIQSVIPVHHHFLALMTELVTPMSFM